MDFLTQPLLSATPDRLATASAEGLANARAALDRFKALAPDTPFDTVVQAWNGIGRQLNGLTGVVALFFQVHPQAELRERAASVEQDVSRFGTELSLDRAAYDRLAALDLQATEDPVARRIVEHALRDFRRAGVDKAESVRERVRALREELVGIGQEFSRNIASDVRTLTISEGTVGLDGLPCRVMSRSRRTRVSSHRTLSVGSAMRAMSTITATSA